MLRSIISLHYWFSLCSRFGVLPRNSHILWRPKEEDAKGVFRIGSCFIIALMMKSLSAAPAWYILFLFFMPGEYVDMLNFVVFAAIHDDPLVILKFAKIKLFREFSLSAANPYGPTKLIIEDICRDLYHAEFEGKIILMGEDLLFGGTNIETELGHLLFRRQR